MRITFLFQLSRLWLLMTAVWGIQSCGSTKDLFTKKDSISNKVIEFDFAKGSYPKVESLEPKQNVELVLLNVPVNAYDVTVNDSLITYPTQQPAQFGQIFKVPDLSPVPAEAPKTENTVDGAVPADNTTAGKAKKAEKDQQNELQDLIDHYAIVEQATKNIISYGDIPAELKKLLTDCSAPLAMLIKQSNDFIENQIPALNGNAIAFPMGIESTVTNETTEAISNISKFISTAESLKKKYQSILENADEGITLQQFRALEKQINEKIHVIDKMLANGKILKNKIEEFEKAKVGKAIVDSYNSVKSARKKITKVIQTGYGTDEVLITVGVKKKENINCDLEVTGFPVSAIVKGGIKIDFSTGIVFNIGRNKFFDQKYRQDSVYRSDNKLADSISIRHNRNKDILVPSVGVFMHVYCRGLRQVRLGGMLGASIGTDQRVYYHLGGLLMFGKSDRFIIGFGASVAQAETLDGAYEEGQIIKRSLAPSTIPVEKGTRVGGFVSFSYNLNLIK